MVQGRHNCRTSYRYYSTNTVFNVYIRLLLGLAQHFRLVCCGIGIASDSCILRTRSQSEAALTRPSLCTIGHNARGRRLVCTQSRQPWTLLSLLYKELCSLPRTCSSYQYIGYMACSTTSSLRSRSLFDFYQRCPPPRSSSLVQASQAAFLPSASYEHIPKQTSRSSSEHHPFV